MDKGERIINIHYIGVVKEVNGFLKYYEVDIPQKENLISEIEAMKENDNRTLLDVQQRFTSEYPRECVLADGYSIWSPDGYYNYLYHPYSYSSSYVKGAGYPVILSYDDYKKRIQDKEESLRIKYLLSEEAKDQLEIVKNISEEDYNTHISELEEKIASEVKDYIKELRQGFNYVPFIRAHNYKIKLREICNETDVRMFSTAQIGWKNFEYRVNDDIVIYIKTNFGYGSASYFFCNLSYKDINILPYSWTVKYYYVEMEDFMRYTRRYLPERESWSEVFDFTVLTANMAKFEPEKFVKEWIVNEVEEMMSGMRLYMSRTNEALQEFFDLKEKTSSIELKTVAGYTFKNVIRNINDNDKVEYKVLPQEKVMAFKAEKITGCLILLDNLRKLSEISSVVNPYIVEIEEMNIRLQPEIEKHIDGIFADIKQLNKNLDEVVNVLTPLKTQWNNHNNNIILLWKEINEKREDNNKIDLKEAEAIYEAEHPDYFDLKNLITELTKKKECLEKDIRLRKNFLDILTKCQERIGKYLQTA